MLFVYTMGLQSGVGFFANLKQQGLRNSKLTVATLVWGTVLLQLVAWWTHIDGPKAAGAVHGSHYQHLPWPL